MDSILDSIKKLLGLSPEDDSFDVDVIIHINTALSILTQIGVGPDSGFMITDNTTSWDEFLDDLPKLNLVKTYVYMKVKAMFDPPTSGSASEALKRQLDEYECRISYMVDPGPTISMEESQNG